MLMYLLTEVIHICGLVIFIPRITQSSPKILVGASTIQTDWGLESTQNKKLSTIPMKCVYTNVNDAITKKGPMCLVLRLSKLNKAIMCDHQTPKQTKQQRLKTGTSSYRINPAHNS